MWWLLAACGSCLIFIGIVCGTFVPLLNSTSVEYLFVPPGIGTWLLVWLSTAGALGLGFLWVRHVAHFRSPEQVAEARSGRWLAPLCALALAPLGVVAAIPGVGESGAVLGYFFYDLRWWWAAILVGLTLLRAEGCAGGPVRRQLAAIGRWSVTARLLLLDAVLFVGVVAWAVATTPLLDFTGNLLGDEPKYVRYCEAWYQGDGLDISQLVLVAEQPLDARPALLRNGALLLDAIRADARSFVRDAGAFARNPVAFRWNRVRGVKGFVTGRNGGVYQIHQPGTAVLLFPGYLLDRYLLTFKASADGKFPSELPMTNVMMVLTYGICAVLLFRLLRRALGSDELACLWAALGMLTLPTTAFAFQLYPELPALLIVLAVTNYLWFPERDHVWTALVAGAASGALAWIHPRFVLVSLCFVVVAWFKKSGRSRRVFMMAFAFWVLSLMWFAYHVTGSWVPTALWAAANEGVRLSRLTLAAFGRNFAGYAIDGTWGVLPHSLILIGAVPGLIVLARERPAHAAFVVAIALSLLVPSAADGLTAAGTTPARLILAAMPLLIWPTAVLVRRLWFSPWMRTLTVIFATLSLQAALAYNVHHGKEFGPMNDLSVSGWKPNLGFPVLHGNAWDSSRANFLLFLVFAAILVGTAALAYAWSKRPVQASAPADRPDWLVPACVISLIVGGFTAATPANGDWTSARYLMDSRTATSVAAAALLASGACLGCVSSRHGHTDWKQLEPNSARGAHIIVDKNHLSMSLGIAVEGDEALPAFGLARVEFGDESETPWTGVVGALDVVHTYRRPGRYDVKIWFRTKSPPIRLYQEAVDVNAEG